MVVIIPLAAVPAAGIGEVAVPPLKDTATDGPVVVFPIQPTPTAGTFVIPCQSIPTAQLAVPAIAALFALFAVEAYPALMALPAVPAKAPTKVVEVSVPGNVLFPANVCASVVMIPLTAVVAAGIAALALVIA